MKHLMSIRGWKRKAWAAACLGTMGGVAQAQVVNGDFSQGGTGWTTTGSVDFDTSVANSLGGTQDPLKAGDGGGHYVDLTGTGTIGSISQQVATAAGQEYELSFYFGGNPQWQYDGHWFGYPNDSAIKSMDVLLDGTLAGSYSVDTTGAARGDGSWTLETILFTATSSLTTLTFESLNGIGVGADNISTVFGPLLSDVKMTAVTAPVSVPLPDDALLMVAGLGALLPLLRKRKADA